jgi:hypothetical protein
MGTDLVVGDVWMIVMVGVVLLLAALRGRDLGGGVRSGPGTMGAVYDWVNEDKRKAVGIIVDDRPR